MFLHVDVYSFTLYLSAIWIFGIQYGGSFQV